jgi:uncharacterized tellurite resistance protein B-like protein
MTKKKLLLTLAKTIVAAAWADGEVSHDERNSLKDLLFQLRDLTATDWAELEIYIDAPIDSNELERLLSELQTVIVSPKDKQLALNALQEMIEADGEVTEDEKVVAQEIADTIQAVDVSLFGQMGRFVRVPIQRRQQRVTSTPNRELYLDDFRKNRIYYQIQRRLDLGEAELQIPEADLRKLGLAGGLLARVAHVDEQVTEEEFTAIVDALQEGWQLDRDSAAFVAEIAISEYSINLDHFRLNREFFTSTTKKEREQFVETLFTIARADGDLSHYEIEEIRLIARGLKLTHKQFIDAKLKS